MSKFKHYFLCIFILSFLMGEVDFDVNTTIVADVNFGNMVDVFNILQL